MDRSLDSHTGDNQSVEIGTINFFILGHFGGFKILNWQKVLLGVMVFSRTNGLSLNKNK